MTRRFHLNISVSHICEFIRKRSPNTKSAKIGSTESLFRLVRTRENRRRTLIWLLYAVVMAIFPNLSIKHIWISDNLVWMIFAHGHVRRKTLHITWSYTQNNWKIRPPTSFRFFLKNSFLLICVADNMWRPSARPYTYVCFLDDTRIPTNISHDVVRPFKCEKIEKDAQSARPHNRAQTGVSVCVKLGG